jgi:transposase
MFPETVEQYISEENPVRFIDAFVDRLDLESLGIERAQPATTGRPAYDPKDLLKLYIYGY